MFEPPLTAFATLFQTLPRHLMRASLERPPSSTSVLYIKQSALTFALPPTPPSFDRLELVKVLPLPSVFDIPQGGEALLTVDLISCN